MSSVVQLVLGGLCETQELRDRGGGGYSASSLDDRYRLER